MAIDSGKLAMFGKSYNTVGNNKANLCLYTAGDVKIKTANKFVTIFKNGKLAVDDTSEIFTVSSEDEIKKTGIYLVTSTDNDGNESQLVYLNIDGTKILLASSNDGFVSYNAAQELTAEQFLQALKNIGFYFQTLDDAKASSITEGLVYILETQELYKVVNGEFTVMSASTSDSGDSASDDSKDSESEETATTLQIGGIFIDGENYLIDGDSELIIQVSGTDYIWLKNDHIYFKRDIILDTDRTITSPNAEEGVSGFLYYTRDDETWLEVDNLVVHNSSSDYEPSLYSAYIGSAVRNLIRTATWESAPTDIQLTLKYRNDFQVGDQIAIQTTGGNAATASSYISSTTDDSGVETTKQFINVTLEQAPTQTSVLKVTYTVNIDEDTQQQKSVEVTIEPTAIVDDDDNPGTTVEEANTYGETEVSTSDDIDSIDSVELVSGDSDIYDANNGSGGRSIPVPYFGTVTSANPLTINVPTLSESTTSILSNLVNSVIYKITSETATEYILYHTAHNIALQECSVDSESGELSRKTISKFGNLSDIKKPIGSSETATEEHFDGEGIYSDHFIGVGSLFYGGTFEGVDGNEYPVYGEKLEMPEENYDSDDYNKVIPDIAWVKALIKKALESVSTETIEESEETPTT